MIHWHRVQDSSSCCLWSRLVSCHGQAPNCAIVFNAWLLLKNSLCAIQCQKPTISPFRDGLYSYHPYSELGDWWGLFLIGLPTSSRTSVGTCNLRSVTPCISVPRVSSISWYIRGSSGGPNTRSATGAAGLPSTARWEGELFLFRTSVEQHMWNKGKQNSNYNIGSTIHLIARWEGGSKTWDSNQDHLQVVRNPMQVESLARSKCRKMPIESSAQQMSPNTINHTPLNFPYIYIYINVYHLSVGRYWIAYPKIGLVNILF